MQIVKLTEGGGVIFHPGISRIKMEPAYVPTAYTASRLKLFETPRESYRGICSQTEFCPGISGPSVPLYSGAEFCLGADFFC